MKMKKNPQKHEKQTPFKSNSAFYVLHHTTF